MMRDTIFISTVSIWPAATAPSRLDTVLSSAEAALARAEEHLRRAQEARKGGALLQLLDDSVFERYPRVMVTG